MVSDCISAHLSQCSALSPFSVFVALSHDTVFSFHSGHSFFASEVLWFTKRSSVNEVLGFRDRHSNRDLSDAAHSCSTPQASGQVVLAAGDFGNATIVPRVPECAMSMSVFGQSARLEPLFQRVRSLGLLLPAKWLQPSTCTPSVAP